MIDDELEFGGPASYRVIIQGVLQPKWTDRLGGLVVTRTTPSGSGMKTTLTGWLHDQAELNGVLNTLYGLHLPILKVERIDKPSEAYEGTI
jgi:hypothetical protein